MTFEHFKKLVANIQNLPLPGESSQLKMAPAMRLVEQKIESIKNDSARKAAVLALLNGNDKMCLTLIERTPDNSVHSGQISLPGGKVEIEDKNYLETAQRETYEEIGIEANQYEIIRPLTDIYIPPSNFYVQPYLAYTKEPLEFIRQKREVAKVIQFPIEQLLDDRAVINKELMSAYKTKIEVPAFLYEHHMVWGATAMILSEIRDLLKQVL